MPMVPRYTPSRSTTTVVALAVLLALSLRPGRRVPTAITAVALLVAAGVGLFSGGLSAWAYLQVAALGRSGEPEHRVVFYFSLMTALGGIGIWLVAHNQITVGVLTAFIAYIGRFYSRLDSMSRIVSGLRSTSAREVTISLTYRLLAPLAPPAVRPSDPYSRHRRRKEALVTPAMGASSTGVGTTSGPMRSGAGARPEAQASGRRGEVSLIVTPTC